MRFLKDYLQYCHAEFMCELHLIPETSKWMKGGNSNCILISLILQAYCRFSGIPLKVTQGNNPLKSPSGITKYLKFRSISPIFRYLTWKDIYFSIKTHLNFLFRFIASVQRWKHNKMWYHQNFWLLEGTGIWDMFHIIAFSEQFVHLHELNISISNALHMLTRFRIFYIFSILVR